MHGLSYSDRLCFRYNTPHRQIAGRELQPDLLTECEATKFSSGFTAHISQETVPVRQLHTIPKVRQHFNYSALSFDGTFSGHVSISGSDSVIKTVCSK